MSHTYNCITCNYFTDRKSSYDKHLSTAKHAASLMPTITSPPTTFICNICNASYAYRSGLSKHKKTCQSYNVITSLLDEITQIKQLLLKKNELTI